MLDSVFSGNVTHSLEFIRTTPDFSRDEGLYQQ